MKNFYDSLRLEHVLQDNETMCHRKYSYLNFETNTLASHNILVSTT